jgi:hypothetical protein
VENDNAFPCADSSACLSNEAGEYFCTASPQTCDGHAVGTCLGDIEVQICKAGFLAGVDCAASGGICIEGACRLGLVQPVQSGWPWLV